MKKEQNYSKVVHKKNEHKAITVMMDRSKIKEPVLLIADRGCESYNLLAHAQENGWKYLIRIRNLGTATGIASKLDLPMEKEFNSNHTIRMTRRQTNEIKRQPQLYRFLANHSTLITCR